MGYKFLQHKNIFTKKKSFLHVTMCTIKSLYDKSFLLNLMCFKSVNLFLFWFQKKLLKKRQKKMEKILLIDVNMQSRIIFIVKSTRLTIFWTKVYRNVELKKIEFIQIKKPKKKLEYKLNHYKCYIVISNESI